MALEELAQRSHAYLLRFPELLGDVEGVKELPDPRNPEPARWLAYWRKNPIEAWAGTEGDTRRWFAVGGERLAPRLPPCPGGEDVLAAMTREIVEWRLVDYLSRLRAEASGDSFECVVLSNRRDPILKLPARAARPDLPSGEADVRLPDGAAWRFRFMKEFCNVARPLGAAANQLPDLLRGWFGPGAGRPETRFRVRFTRSPDGWWIEPVSARVVPIAARGNVIAFPTRRAAAGHVPLAGDRVADAASLVPAPETVRLSVADASPDRFAVRATGDSMDGGGDPIRDGDWVVLRYARSASLASLDGRVALVEVPGTQGDGAYQLKRVVRDGGRWLLASDNPAGPTADASADTTAIALVEQVVRPEDLSPAVGERVAEDGLARAFGLSRVPGASGSRTDGHLLLRVEGRGVLVAPDRVRWTIEDRRPGETAFVLTRAAAASVAVEPWRFAGVGHWVAAEQLWAISPVDFATWRALGAGREVSQRLPAGALEQAREVVRAALDRPGVGGWLERDGKRVRIVGEARKGGLRIDGGPGGFAERTVSLLDLAWVLVAAGDVREKGGVLDEARVNRLRYLEGTPKGATRWIDTGWALLIVAALRTGAGEVGRGT